MENLTQLPNIGDTLAKKLNAIEINSCDDLISIGSVDAVLKIGENDQNTCYNMLYALEGAIRGVRWHAIPKEHRKQLKDEYDAACIKESK
jgi:DNA transformation protein